MKKFKSRGATGGSDPPRDRTQLPIAGLAAEVTRLDGVLLLEEVFDTLGVEHADAKILQLGCGSGGQTFLRPTRYWAKALLDLPA